MAKMRGRDKFKQQKKRQARRSEKAERQRQRGLVVFSIVMIVLFIAWAAIKTVQANSDTYIAAEGWVLPKLSGKGNVKIEDYSGKPAVTTFFSRSCATCNDDMNAKLSAQNQLDDKVTFIGVASQEPTKPSGKVFAEQSGLLKWPLAKDTDGKNFDGLLRATGGTSMPYTVIYDPNGRKVFATQAPMTSEALIAQLNRLFHIQPPTPNTPPTTAK